MTHQSNISHKKKVTASAPGKLMIMGEHAVVYGYPCIVSAVNKYLTVKINISKEKKDIIITPGFSDNRFVKEALISFRDKFSLKESIVLKTRSELGNFGLGSSAAVTVAILKALAKIFSLPLSRKELFNFAYKIVQKVQGIGSGFDVAAAIYGGTIYFSKRGEVIESLPTSGMNLVVGYSGVKAETVSLVNLVRQKRRDYPKGIEEIFRNIAELVEKAKMAILTKDWERLGTLMNFNQDYLENLGVSNEKLNSMILAAKNAGAYGAKLSGAGGGDCMIALVSKKTEDSIKKAIEKVGGEMVDVKVGTEGVKIEQ